MFLPSYTRGVLISFLYVSGFISFICFHSVKIKQTFASFNASSIVFAYVMDLFYGCLQDKTSSNYPGLRDHTHICRRPVPKEEEY